MKKRTHRGKALCSAMELLRTRRPHVVSEYRANGQGRWPWRPTAVASPIFATYCGMFTAALMHLIWKTEMTIIVPTSWEFWEDYMSPYYIE